MARVPYLEQSDLSAENQDLLKRRINLSQALVNSPDAARAFLGLGQNALDFEIQVYVSDIMRGGVVASEIRLDTIDAFRKQGEARANQQ